MKQHRRGFEPTDSFAYWLEKQFASDPGFERRFREGSSRLFLGYDIQCRREDIGLTQADLATKIGTSQRAIKRIELGEQPRVTLATLQNIGDALGLELTVEFRKPAKRKSRSARGASRAVVATSQNPKPKTQNRTAAPARMKKR